jgi:mono/diheme cytochrome c family protein
MKITLTPLLALTLLGLSCGDDDDAVNHGDKDAGGWPDGWDAGDALDAGAAIDAGSSIDATSAQLDAAQDAGTGLFDAAPDGGEAALIARGRYLVDSVGACADCHTPRKADGSFDLTRSLAGVDCFVDAVPADDQLGCLSSRNLTNDETGLRNRSDVEIKDMFLRGVRPDGKALHPIMPYWTLGNMRPADADAIVAFLRTVAPVSHMVRAAQPPFADVPAPAPLWPDALIPQPRADYPERAAALRGRYLAGSIGVCMECHSPRSDADQPIVTRAFEGGRPFGRAELGLPDVFPERIYASNLTPDATGILGYDVAKIVATIKQGVDEENKPLCPPMPAGPMGAFGGMSDADAEDIGHYLLSLPPKVNALPNECTLPAAPPAP